MSDEIEQQIKDALAAEGINADEAMDKATEKDETPVTKDHGDREFTELEQEQLAKGWDPDGVKSAEEFARAEPLYEKIKAQSKELKQTKRAVDELKALMQKQEKLAYQKALDTLRQEKDEAILRGDLSTVREIEKQQQEMDNAPQPVAAPVADFLERYGDLFKSTDYEEMKIVEFVTRRDSELMRRKLPPEEHVKLVEEHMMKEFPNYFGAGKETVGRAQGVEAGLGSNVAGKPSAIKKHTFHSLSDEQKKVARDFEKLGIMKTDEYIKSLVDLGELS